MSEFFHEFSIGFNWWFITLPVSFLLMVLVGKCGVWFNERTTKICHYKHKKLMFVMAATILTLFNTALVLVESLAGFRQVVWNSMQRNDSPFWAELIVVFGAIALPVLLMLCYYSLGLYIYRRKLCRAKAKQRWLRHLRSKRPNTLLG